MFFTLLNGGRGGGAFDDLQKEKELLSGMLHVYCGGGGGAVHETFLSLSSGWEIKAIRRRERVSICVSVITKEGVCWRAQILTLAIARQHIVSRK